MSSVGGDHSILQAHAIQQFPHLGGLGCLALGAGFATLPAIGGGAAALLRVLAAAVVAATVLVLPT